MTRPQAVAFDLDGTLAESKQRVSAEMGLLVAQLLEKTPVAIMSGASFAQFQTQFFPGLPEKTNLANLYIFPDNAAQCFVYANNVWHPQYDHVFSGTEKEHITTALNRALEELDLSKPPTQVWGERLEDRDAQISFSFLGQQAPVEEKRHWHDAHDDIRKKLHEVLVGYLPEFAVSMGGLTTIDITRKGVTKAYGIKQFSELTHVAVANILYVGDALEEGGNDSVVIETGVATHAVFGPQETAKLIESIIGA